MEKHFTATAYILKGDQTLLIYHKKLQKWLPPGGHVEENESPVEAAKREALEETGLEIEIIKDEHLWIVSPNASSFERPYLCLIENIPAYGNKPAHQHIDMIYIATPSGGKELPELLRSGELKWFTQEDLLSLKPEKEIFSDTLETLAHLFSKLKV